MNRPRLTSRVSLLLTCGQLMFEVANGGEAVTFTNAADVHHLGHEASARSYPVKLKGVVTYSDAPWNLLFIRDASGGAFVVLSGGTYPTNSELVEVVGHTEDGSFLPVVAGASWRHLGSGNLPEPRRVSQPDRFASEIDCEWSELVGVVRGASLNAERNHVQLDLIDGEWRARVFLPAPEGRAPVALEDLMDAKVSVSGVAGVDYADEKGGISLKAFVPGPTWIRVVEKRPAAPFELPRIPLSKVFSWTGTNLPAHRVHVRGLVTYKDGSGEFVLQEDNSALRVRASGSQTVSAGDSLEAVGFISPGIFTPVMEDTELRSISTKVQAAVVQVAPATVLWGNYDARLVQLTGILQKHEVNGRNHLLTLLEDGVLFGASLEDLVAGDAWRRFKKGDRVRVTGVCSVKGAQRTAPQSFQVLLRERSDVVYSPATPEFSAWQVLLILGAAGAAWGLVFLWGMILKRRVHERTKELAQSLSLLNATLESTAEGILVVGQNGRVSSYNTIFARMWQLPIETIESREEEELLGHLCVQLKDTGDFCSHVRAINAKTEAESLDTLEFKDGRVFERYSQPQRLNGRCVGRVWSFRDVTARNKAEAQLAGVNQKLLETSRRVGMAEVATAVLHNVGNVLNSVNVSANLVNDRLRRSRAQNLVQAAEMMEARMDNLDKFLSEDPKGIKLRVYLKDLSVALLRENDEVRTEVESLRRNIEHIKTIVAMQQSYAQVGGGVEVLNANELMENAVQINGAAYERDRIRLVRDYKAVPQVLVDRHKVLQILVNLLSNARHALEEKSPHDRRVSLSIFSRGPDRVCLTVSDNGAGIAPDHLGRIFSQGFTTRKDGHGFGLHSSANAASAMNGNLRVQSDGPAKGAVFTLELPTKKPSDSAGRHD